MIRLTDIERADLRAHQKRERGSDLYIRITVLLMSDCGFSVSDIEQSLGIDQTTVNRYFRLYESVGLEQYLTFNYVAYEGKLTASETAILDKELQDYLYVNTYEVIAFIKREFGKDYKPSGVSKLLHRLGYTYKKTKQESCNADPVEQTEFLQEMTQMLDKIEAQQAESVAYFLDGVHPQHNTKAAYAWIKKGEEWTVGANTGRKRVNINGALNAHDVTDVLIDEADTINQDSVKRLILQIVLKQPLKQIYLIHDNARYYYAKDLRQWIGEHCPNVTQVFLPPYSPNLNLIERLWKFMKKKIINYDFYPTFQHFKDKVLAFFQNIKQYRSELETLLTLNFHIA
jgi:transposase